MTSRMAALGEATDSSRGAPVDIASRSPGAGGSVESQTTRRGSSAICEGIGLSIVKRLAELLDATLEVHTEAGAGTTFRVLLARRYSSQNARLLRLVAGSGPLVEHRGPSGESFFVQGQVRLRPEVRQIRSHEIAELFAVQRLLEICVESGLERRGFTEAEGSAGMCYQHETSPNRLLLAKCLRGGKTVQDRHVEVEDDDVGSERSRCLHSLSAVVRRQSLVPRHLEKLDGRVGGVWVVIGNEDPRASVLHAQGRYDKC